MTGRIIIAMCFMSALSSCQKEELETTDTTISDEEAYYQTNMMQKWVLVDGWIYLENMETGQKTRYRHFDNSKSLSSMRLPQFYYPLEILEQYETTWDFTYMQVGSNMFEFVLNDTDTMAFSMVGNYKTIIEHPQAGNQEDMHLGGSAKPFFAWTDDGYNMKIRIHEAYTSFNGYNYKYFNVLEFQPY